MSQRLLDKQPFARPVLLGEIIELSGQIKKNIVISGLLVAFITFFMALLVSLGSEALVRAVNSVLVAFSLLLVIIFLGIFFDIIGTAVTAAELPPFNARAAKKIFGAKQGVKLIHNADIVANFCNDVIGDIAGTLSGAIGAGIVVSLVRQFAVIDLALAGAVMTSLIAALTVGGKAMGKKLAVNNADNIISKAAKVVAWLEQLSGWELFKNRK